WRRVIMLLAMVTILLQLTIVTMTLVVFNPEWLPVPAYWKLRELVPQDIKAIIQLQTEQHLYNVQEEFILAEEDISERDATILENIEQNALYTALAGDIVHIAIVVQEAGRNDREAIAQAVQGAQEADQLLLQHIDRLYRGYANPPTI